MSDGQRPWEILSESRRRWLTVLIVVPAAALGIWLQTSLSKTLPLGLEILSLVIFVLLFAWISAGFWTALVGFLVLFRQRLGVHLEGPERHRQRPRAETRVAVILPIYNEDVGRVLAGLQATWRSLQRSGYLQYFDFFVLSDTRDPGVWLQEELAWSALCQELNAFGRIFYRRRPINNHAKSGNVADFCRRWGSQYDYMVVLDADSVMSGESLYAMLEMMEGNPRVGVLQTQPLAVNRETLYARTQQFAQQVYGPLFSAGLRFWQLGDGHFIGHNAMLRVAPFTEACALPVLPGKSPLGGQLLSHDFVEASLMARAGWEVWFLPTLPGSYEEVPPTLLDDLKRDRRWAQGNLQHLRLLAADGLRSAHRFLFINGAMSFLAAPLWGLFLVLGGIASVEVWLRGATETDWTPFQATGADPLPFWLFGLTTLFLLGPKVLAYLWVLVDRRAKSYGGAVALIFSIFLESLLAIVLAPVRMVFHSTFVIQTLLGRSVHWGAQVRADQATSWSVGWRNFGILSSVGIVALLALPQFLEFWHFVWLLPIFSGLALAVPLAVLTSRQRWGRGAKRARLFVIPEELHPPRELQDLDPQLVDFVPNLGEDPFVTVVVDPHSNAVHAALQRHRNGQWGVTARLCHKALALGPAHLDRRERNILLQDRQSMLTLHRAVWSITDPEKLAAWGLDEGMGMR